MESVKQELILLRSLLLGDEFEWHVEDEATQQAWEVCQICSQAIKRADETFFRLL